MKTFMGICAAYSCLFVKGMHLLSTCLQCCFYLAFHAHECVVRFNASFDFFFPLFEASAARFNEQFSTTGKNMLPHCTAPPTMDTPRPL